jgi:hypothetical protein
MRRLLLSLAFLSTALTTFAADTPEDVVKRQVDAMRAGDWDKFTASMHAPALKEFQTTIVNLLTAAPEGPMRTQMLQAFFSNKPLAEVSAATPEAFFGMFMNGLAQSNPAIKQGMASSEAQILGHVDEAPDKAHVVMRMTMSIADGKVTKMDVTSLQREGDTWKALLKGDMQQVVAGLQKMLQAK